MAHSARERTEGVRTRFLRTPVAPAAAAAAGPTELIEEPAWSAFANAGSRARVHLLRRRGGLLLGHRDDLGRLGDLLLVGEHEGHELLDLRALHRLVARVHVHRAGERLVGAVLDGLRARLDAAVAG